MLRLYHHPRSTFSRRVRILLLEKQVEHEPIEVEMAARAHRAMNYLALNPYGRVPTIDDNGVVLYESAAILQYLEATRPTPALVPADAAGRALVDMHLRLVCKRGHHDHRDRARPSHSQGQFSSGRGRRRRDWSRKTQWAMALTEWSRESRTVEM